MVRKTERDFRGLCDSGGILSCRLLEGQMLPRTEPWCSSMVTSGLAQHPAVNLGSHGIKPVPKSRSFWRQVQRQNCNSPMTTLLPSWVWQYSSPGTGAKALGSLPVWSEPSFSVASVKKFYAWYSKGPCRGGLVSSEATGE